MRSNDPGLPAMLLRRSGMLFAVTLVAQLTSQSAFLSLGSAAQEPGIEASSSLHAYAVADGQSPERELEKALEQLKNQITEQQELLKAAQTDRERERIQNLLSFLQDEQQTLEGLFEQIAGTDYANFEESASTAEEGQSEHRSEQHEDTLDKAR